MVDNTEAQLVAADSALTAKQRKLLQLGNGQYFGLGMLAGGGLGALIATLICKHYWKDNGGR